MSRPRWAMVIDTRTCVGCSACVLGCKTENDVPDGCGRDWIVSETTGVFPDLRMTIRSERCNQCADAPCVRACPTGSSHYGPGGVVLVNRDKCSGCKACIAACPYGARFVDPRTGTVDKCTFCMHRIDNGIPTTSCQDTCPTQSIAFGDLNDPASEVRRLLASRAFETLQSEVGTEPMVFYLT
jgi:Fe-S-cluster-containing dehydrogenase component